jgi:hypothetical protein
MSMRGKMGFELIVGFFQPAHSFSDFETNLAFQIKAVMGEFMLVNDFLEEHSHGELACVGRFSFQRQERNP